MKQYFGFLAWVVDKDCSKLKFMDEVHFVSKDVSKRRALGPAGANICLIRNEHFAETYSFSCISSITQGVYISGRIDNPLVMDFYAKATILLLIMLVYMQLQIHIKHWI